MTPNAPLLLHASCVAVNGRGLLILGKSGAGKSSLALQMIGLGADLVADDQTQITRRGGQLIATAPAQIKGLIEARFVGLLNVPALVEACVVLAIDLDQTETDRLPPTRQIMLDGIACALAYSSPAPHLAASLMLYLGHGRRA